MQSYYFYTGTKKNIKNVDVFLPKGYRLEIWKPSLFRIRPQGCAGLSFLVYWLMHILGIFETKKYCRFIVYYDNNIAHCSVVSPKSFKHPFMGESDLQIGPVDTAKGHLQKGLASYVIKHILDYFDTDKNKFWWIVRTENAVSIKTIEKFGFSRSFIGLKKKILGIPGSSIYFIKHKLIDDEKLLQTSSD